MIITGIYASLLACFILVLALNVIRVRRKYRIGLLDGGNEHLMRAMRLHGNAIEYIPIVLILFVIAEANGLSIWLLHIIGISLIGCRLWHAWGLSHSSGISKGRYFGTLGTCIIIVILAVYNIFIGIIQFI